jgi:hypothetical protein
MKNLRTRLLTIIAVVVGLLVLVALGHRLAGNRPKGYAFTGHRATAAELRLLLDQSPKTPQNDLPALGK